MRTFYALGVEPRRSWVMHTNCDEENSPFLFIVFCGSDLHARLKITLKLQGGLIAMVRIGSQAQE
jgi:hypothetical protein